MKKNKLYSSGYEINVPIKAYTNYERQRSISKEHIQVIVGASLGNIIEWYDFLLYGSLASIIAQHFFSSLHESAAFLMALITFAAGFIVRPLGAVVFGPIGDKIGRKYTFLVTIVLMGLSTFCVGILPTYHTIGLAAPIILVTLRCLQGLTVGGEYGGAATYVAEHAPDGQRGFYTGFIQGANTVGFILSSMVIIVVRSILGESYFQAWGWRIPFIASSILLMVSVYIRMRLQESPVFQEMKEANETSKSPLIDSFKSWQNIKLMLLMLFGPVSGHAVIWYCNSFYMLYFLTQTLKVDFLIANIIMTISLIAIAGFYIFFGWLSDRTGPKIINMSGCLFGALFIYPIFLGMTHFANPDLELAMHNYPAVLIADPAECHFQFAPSELKEHIHFTSSCDVLKDLLAQNGVSYKNEEGMPGSLARVMVGNRVVESLNISGMDPLEASTVQANFSNLVKQVISEAGYPMKADSLKINYFMVILLYMIAVIFPTMTFGPLAYWLVDLFPPNIRYTSLSIPYHIANGWIGGIAPSVSYAIVLMTGNIYAGLVYPIGFAFLAVIVGWFLKDVKSTERISE